MFFVFEAHWLPPPRTNQPSLGDTSLNQINHAHQGKDCETKKLNLELYIPVVDLFMLFFFSWNWKTEKHVLHIWRCLLDMFLLHYLTRRCTGTISSPPLMYYNIIMCIVYVYYHVLFSNIRPLPCIVASKQLLMHCISREKHAFCWTNAPKNKIKKNKNWYNTTIWVSNQKAKMALLSRLGRRPWVELSSKKL